MEEQIINKKKVKRSGEEVWERKGPSGQDNGTKAQRVFKSQQLKVSTKGRITSLKEVEEMSEMAIRLFSLSGLSKKRVHWKMKDNGINYYEAKRWVISENFKRSLQDKGPDKVRQPDSRSKTEEPIVKKPKQVYETPLESESPLKKAKQELKSCSVAHTGIKVAVVHKDYPDELLSTFQVKELNKSIRRAFELKENGLQVCFNKSQYMPGYLQMICTDNISVKWLERVVSGLVVEGISLRTLTGLDLPKTQSGTLFIPDNNKQRLTIEKVIGRLSTGNRSIKPQFWTVLDEMACERGVTYIFQMENSSMNYLKEIDFQVYFPFDMYLKFEPKENKEDLTTVKGIEPSTCRETEEEDRKKESTSPDKENIL